MPTLVERLRTRLWQTDPLCSEAADTLDAAEKALEMAEHITGPRSDTGAAIRQALTLLRKGKEK